MSAHLGRVRHRAEGTLGQDMDLALLSPSGSPATAHFPECPQGTRGLFTHPGKSHDRGSHAHGLKALGEEGQCIHPSHGQEKGEGHTWHPSCPRHLDEKGGCFSVLLVLLWQGSGVWTGRQ